MEDLIVLPALCGGFRQPNLSTFILRIEYLWLVVFEKELAALAWAIAFGNDFGGVSLRLLVNGPSQMEDCVFEVPVDE